MALNESLAGWWSSRIIEELRRAKEKFPAPFVNSHEAYAVLLEEVDEFWDNVKNDRPISEKQEEAVQIAAMALRFVVELGSPQSYVAARRLKSIVKPTVVPEDYEDPNVEE